MPDALSLMRLVGDEDGDVWLECYRGECDPHHHGEVARYGRYASPGQPYFDPDQLAAFIEFIHQHAESHWKAERDKAPADVDDIPPNAGSAS